MPKRISEQRGWLAGDYTCCSTHVWIVYPGVRFFIIRPKLSEQITKRLKPGSVREFFRSLELSFYVQELDD